MTALAFELPHGLEATAPPEQRGMRRDDVRLLVADGAAGGLVHARFSELPDLLDAGDLLVINVSQTLPAAVAGVRGDGEPVRIHFSTRAPERGTQWRVVELRSPDGAVPQQAEVGERIALTGLHGELELVAGYLNSPRLMLARHHGLGTIEDLLTHHGEPIRYGYVSGRWPLSAYQTVYATVPGSSEMPSAGRPFTAELITALVGRGITIAPLVLHAGVSSPERHEPPFPEEYAVPEATAALVNLVRGAGRRVIAVGTTVVRALETVASDDGSVRAGAGWTDLVIDPERGVRSVDGLITGWHEPEASHLQMLTAIAGEELLERSYGEALRHGYLWHEFGDSHLVLA
ncbi:MAG TPA: S-adenosylmethionine:tRNA ribosyltransferase-isomerase [Solirubrobacteraceae bacterium]|nr:S-adenosylmethionine:tRNA ribosyltransferase-isomerase [Solirubrobacteraceae bacterium]